MDFHDIIFLGLALALITLMLTGRDLLKSGSPVRQALAAPVRILAKSRKSGLGRR